MASEDASTSHPVTLAVELSPTEPFADTGLRLKIQVSCSERCDLRGGKVLIQAPDGSLLDSAEIDQQGEGTSEISFALTAPSQAAIHTWSAVFSMQENDGVRHEESAVPFSFTVKPHPTSVAVWDVPYSSVLGEPFTIKVGIKCAIGCPLGGWPFEVHDHEGTLKASGVVNSEALPGTTALYYSQAELETPEVIGYSRWTVSFPSVGADGPHEAGSYEFGVTTVRPPEFLVTVQVIDEEHHEPIKGARVVMHPFRSVTDENGVAELRVTRGEYKLFVSGFNYVTFRMPVDVTGDLALEAPLAVEPEPNLHEFR